MTGRRMEVEEAIHFGLINRHCEGELLVEQALASIKAITRSTQTMELEQAYVHMRQNVPVYKSMLHSDDASEGTNAFAQKRQPHWQGK